MAKIGIDCRLWGTANTGIGRYTQELVENLYKIDNKGEYVLFCRAKDYDKIHVARWKKVIADIPHYTFSEQTKLVQIFMKENLDLLHTPHFNVPILYPRPYVLTIHDILWHKSKGTKVTNLPPPSYWGKYAAYRVVVKIAVNRAKKIIVPSHAVETDVVHYFPRAKNKVIVTYEGTPNKNLQFRISNFQLIAKKYNIAKPYLLCVGNLYPHKNIEILIKAIKRYHDSSNDIKLVIVSRRGVFQEKFHMFLEKEKVLHFVKVLSGVGDFQLANLYKRAEAFVFPTKSEGFGLPGLEAMAYGCPVVCSDIPVLKEIYGSSAFYFDPDDAIDIVDKLKKVLADKTLRNNLIKKGKQQVKKYSWRKMVEQTVNAYKEVLALQGLSR